MKISEIRQMTDPELANLERELLREKFNLAVQKRTGHLQNTAKAMQVRRDVARIKTEWKTRKSK